MAGVGRRVREGSESASGEAALGLLRRAGAYGCERSLCVLRLTALRNADDMVDGELRCSAEFDEALRSTRLGW